MDVGQNGRPRGPQMLVWFSINHPIIGVPNFDPYPHDFTMKTDENRMKTATPGNTSLASPAVDRCQGLLRCQGGLQPGQAAT